MSSAFMRPRSQNSPRTSSSPSGALPLNTSMDRAVVVRDAQLAVRLERDRADDDDRAAVIEARIREQRARDSSRGASSAARRRTRPPRAPPTTAQPQSTAELAATPVRQSRVHASRHITFFCAARASTTASATNSSAPTIMPSVPFVKARDEAGHALGLLNQLTAEQHRVQNARERAAGDQAGAEQRAGADFRFLGPAGAPLDVRADQAAGEDRRGRRNRQVGADRERQRVDAAQLERDRDEHADQHQAPRQVLARAAP